MSDLMSIQTILYMVCSSVLGIDQCTKYFGWNFILRNNIYNLRIETKYTIEVKIC